MSILRRALFAGSSVLAAAYLAAASPAAARTQIGAGVLDQDRIDRSPAGPIRPAAAPAQPSGAPLAATFVPFTLKTVIVEGSSLPASSLPTVYASLLGKQLNGPQLAELVSAVLVAYAASDVALYSVSIPQQDFANGWLQLRVIEGRIENGAVFIDGDQSALARLTPQIAKLTKERPLRRSSLERRISLMRDIPGLTLNAELQRSPREGAVKLAVDAKQKSFEAAFNVTNRGTAVLGRTRAATRLA